MVSEDGYVKILDFGLAKRQALGEEGSGVPTVDRDGTTPGTLLGTLSYTSPEQAEGEPAVFRSDLPLTIPEVFGEIPVELPFRGIPLKESEC